jgi:hypothetical protein
MNELVCNICGATLIYVNHEHKRGYCLCCRRDVTAVTATEFLKKSAERVREALAV